VASCPEPPFYWDPEICAAVGSEFESGAAEPIMYCLPTPHSGGFAASFPVADFGAAPL